MRLLKSVTCAALGAAIGGCATIGGDKDYLSNMPAEAAPEKIGNLLITQFFSSEPHAYAPPGYDGPGFGGNRWLPYASCSFWANAIEFAKRQGDTMLADRLSARFRLFLPKKPINGVVSTPYHVDDTIAGAIPYEIYMYNGDKECLAMGNDYADTQWAPPCEKNFKARHAPSEAEIRAWYDQGYSPQTRLWIDDMYMITVLQSQAYRATGDRKYIDRAAKEACLYLDKLQLKEGDVKGLFYHAPDTPYIWGRGDGWMAAGMALILARLPEDSEYRPRIMSAYKMMMATLLKFQRKDGLWAQLVNEPEVWGETSGTAMFTYAFITGVKKGWLPADEYGPAARKGYLALCSKLDKYGNLADICIGTGKRNDHQYYLDRQRVNGDPHGQAALLWCVNALLD